MPAIVATHGPITRYPAAEAIIDAIRPVIVACPDTLELYGYTAPRVDMAASLRRFTGAYRARYNRRPSRCERTSARDHFDAVLEG